MDQVSCSAVGGSDVPPPPEKEQMKDAVGLGVDLELVMRCNITRDKISKYIESKQYFANLQGMLPELVSQLEEILFKVHACKREYYNTEDGPFEPELQLAIQLLSAQNPQNQQLSRQIQTFPVIGTDFLTPRGITQSENGHPMMYSYVTYRTGLASSSPAGLVLPRSANMDNSVPGKDLDDHVDTLLSFVMNHRQKPKVVQAKEVQEEPKFSCPICMNELVDASSTNCGHIFCEKCIRSSIQAQRKCPTCRRKLNLRYFHRLYLPATY